MDTMNSQTNPSACRWCGRMHGPLCPSVKAIEFEADGVTVKRVEFFCPNDYAPVGMQPMPMPAPWTGLGVLSDRAAPYSVC